MAREVFDEIRGKKETISVKKFKSWEGITEIIESGITILKTFRMCIN
jgi:hypothetical protein